MKVFVLALHLTLITVFSVTAFVGVVSPSLATVVILELMTSLLFVATAVRKIAPGESVYVADSKDDASGFRVYWPGTYYAFCIPFVEKIVRVSLA